MNARQLLERMNMNEGKDIPETRRPIRYYDGQDLESGGTSIQGGAAPMVRFLLERGIIVPGMKILDYGAGAYARNADYLREQGFEVYACDEFNFNGNDGWSTGSVAKSIPSGVKFDLGFTSYVLNVVKKQTQDMIVRQVRAFCDQVYHGTMNYDIWIDMWNKLNDFANEGKQSMSSKFFVNEFAPGEPDGHDLVNSLKSGVMVPDEVVTAFCMYGVQTTRGFQRIPQCERLDQGSMSLINLTSGLRLYRDN